MAGGDQKLVFLPGFEGVPVRGIPRDRVVTPEELRRFFILGWDFHVRLFDLTKPEDAEALETLYTAAATMPGHVRVVKEWTPQDMGYQGSELKWQLLVKWGECYRQPQNTGVRAQSSNPLTGA